MGSDTTALQLPMETRSSATAGVMSERSTLSESVKAAAAVSPIEIESPIPGSHTHTGLETQAELRDRGHWELLEMDWGVDARWTC